ncbi:hypothetical protein ACLB2K_058876 [Fragaria x ananassa]
MWFVIESYLLYVNQAITRYKKEFGSLNYRFRVGQVEFIAIDAQAIDGNPQGYMASSTRAFVKNVSLDIQSYPRVLLTHIPLYRQDKTDCGPNRKSEIINQFSILLFHRIVRFPDRREIAYQNYITEESSKYLLDSIQPVLVLSGHDHDQCDVVHKSKYGPVKEHTVGTISWQQGNVYPSFMLLSACDFVPSNTSSSEKPVLTQLCFLPVQLHIYICYLSLFVLTVLALLLGPAGSMHLVKKASNVSVTSKSEKISVERGTTVIRPTAKKNISQELEVSVNADVFDPMAKTLPRASKSWTKLVIQRLVRTFRMLTIIAAVNVPIYMLLLFKDWID